MDVGHLIYFPSQKFPFAVQAEPCLDLDCSCSMMKLTLREVDLTGPPRDRLKFTLRICVKTWREEYPPPPRSLEVETLAREFMIRMPAARKRELRQEFERKRAAKRRLQTVVFRSPPKDLVTYSEVLYDDEERRPGIDRDAFFFAFEGRDFFVEDQYCANPECVCEEIHLEFWERVEEIIPERCVMANQRLLATVSLEGELKEIRFSEESKATTKYLMAAWSRRCRRELAIYRQRYHQIKAIGARSFPVTESSAPETSPPPEREPSHSESRAEHSPTSSSGFGSWETTPSPVSVTVQNDAPRIRRNDPCPCGSGLKFKRCCARRSRPPK